MSWTFKEFRIHFRKLSSSTSSSSLQNNFNMEFVKEKKCDIWCVRVLHLMCMTLEFRQILNNIGWIWREVDLSLKSFLSYWFVQKCFKFPSQFVNEIDFIVLINCADESYSEIGLCWIINALSCSLCRIYSLHHAGHHTDNNRCEKQWESSNGTVGYFLQFPIRPRTRHSWWALFRLLSDRLQSVCTTQDWTSQRSALPLRKQLRIDLICWERLSGKYNISSVGRIFSSPFLVVDKLRRERATRRIIKIKSFRSPEFCCEKFTIWNHLEDYLALALCCKYNLKFFRCVGDLEICLNENRLQR